MEQALRLRVMVVQPIALQSGLLEDLLRSAVRVDLLEKRLALRSQRTTGSTALPEWMPRHGFADRYIASLRCLYSRDGDDNELFRTDLVQHYKGPEPESLLRAFSGVRSHLLFDQKLNYFVATHHLEFAFENHDVFERIFEGYGEAEDRPDFYNQLRFLFVGEGSEEESKTRLGSGSYVKSLYGTMLAEVGSVIGDDFQIKHTPGQVFIAPNTGNMSFFISTDWTGAGFQRLRDMVVSRNQKSERTSKKLQIVSVQENEICIFGGRFHTVIANDEQRRHRYQLIIFHMQYFWFYTLTLFNLIEQTQAELTARRRRALFAWRKDHGETATALILKAQLLGSHHDAFRVRLEADASAVYDAIQTQWSLAESIRQLSHATAFLRDFLEQRALKRRNDIAGRLGITLYIISVLQVLALVNVWTDLLMLTDPNFASGSPIAQWFGDPETLRSFHFYAPMGIFALGGLGLLLLIRGRSED